MGFQEELDALAARYQGQAFDPFENTQSAQVNQPMPMSPAPQGVDGILDQLANLLSPSLSPEGQGRYQESLARPYGQTFQEEGGLGVFNQFMDNNPVPGPMDILKGLGTFIGGESLMGSQQAQAQAPRPSDRSKPLLPSQQEPTLREADPIAQIEQALYSLNGGDLGGEGRGFSKGAAGSSDIAADRYRSVIRDAAVQEAGQGSPLTDEERIGRKMEDVMIGTPRDPGLIGGVSGQDPEVKMQLINSVREITGLDPRKAEDLVDNAEGMSGAEMLGMLGTAAATYGAYKLTKGRAKPKLKTSAGSFPKGPRTGTTKAPSADDLVAKMRGQKATPEVGAFKTGSANKAGGYQGTREVGMPERGFQTRGGSSSQAPDARAIRAERQKANAPKQKALPAGEVPKRLEYLIDKMEKKKLTPEELDDLRDMYKGVFKQKK